MFYIKGSVIPLTNSAFLKMGWLDLFHSFPYSVSLLFIFLTRISIDVGALLSFSVIEGLLTMCFSVHKNVHALVVM